jgi:hypothetical protein
MNDVPKFARQRMAQPVTGDHPEANLLAAFAEGGLTKREREQVLLHLGTCATCRETLAVAMPEIAAGHPIAPAAPSGTRWLRLPMLRWAGVGAAVVVVAAAVVIQSSRRPAEFSKAGNPAPPAKSEQAKQPADSAAVKEAAPVLNERAPTKEVATDRDMPAKAESRTDKKKDAVAFQSVNAAPAMRQANNKFASSNGPAQSDASTQLYAAAESAKVQQQRGSNVAGAQVAGMVATEQKQEQVPAPVSQVGSASESVEIATQTDVMQTQKTKSLDRGQSDFDSMRVARTKPAAEARATTAGAAPSATGGPIAPASAAVHGGPLMKAAVIVPPHWRLSTEGALERSTDAGRTWQLVSVATPPTTLRSFSAVGRDIWAGGTGGTLYHSADGGRTWARVTVKAGDAVLDSDIVRVEFTDAQHGALMTASGEAWTTNDAGATWSTRR